MSEENVNTESKQIALPDTLPKREARVITMMPQNPMEMVALAVSNGAPIETLERLMKLRDDFEKGEARKAYVAAMAAFKAEPIEILKTKSVKIPNGPAFKHATLADVVDGVVASMAKHGLSHKWITDQSGESIKVSCIVTHALGHSEEAVLVAASDKGPGRNGIQAVGSTITYLQRYTLMSICGLAAKDMDDDGRGSQAPQAPESPEGYESWAADMDAKADEGKAAHLKAWQNSAQAFRDYAAKWDADWLADGKAKAKKVGP